MAPLICDLLDYSTTDIYVEPFGGACRTLLNKPPHRFEIYNDGGMGLSTFVALMSNSESAQELIRRLYETEYSRAEFERAKAICEQADDNPHKQIELVKRMRLIGRVLVQFKQEIKAKGQDYTPSPTELAFIKPWVDEYEKLRPARDTEFAGTPETAGIERPDDLELAAATFVIYMQSRDAMGKTWTSYKFKSREQYYKQIDRLYQVAERLNGVEVTQLGAVLYLQNSQLLHEPRAMFYCDPSYLSPENVEKDLGVSYQKKSTIADHKLFLELATQATCKMLISNYDNPLYNEYLRDWRRVEFQTYTGVGSKKDNKRLEVLWYNY